MFFVPSVTIDVAREDEGEDQYGDAVTTVTKVAQGIDAHIYERSLTSAEPTSGRLVTTRVLKAVVAGGQDIRSDDVIYDSEGRTYTVTGITNFYNPFDEAHMEIELRKVR